MDIRFPIPALASAFVVTLALGATAAAAKDPLRVCASTKDAPYSEAGGTGFENRLAGVIAQATGRTLDLVWLDKDAIYLVRDGVDQGLCDVVMGVDANDPRLLTTSPYYRSGYVFVTPEATDLGGDGWEALADPRFDTIAYRFHGPAEVLMKYAGKYENNLIYATSLANFEDRRNKYTNVDAARVVSEVAKGEADMAIVFAPEAARYVKASGAGLKMTLISNHLTRANGVEVPLQFDQAIGVSKTNPALRDEIEQALIGHRAEIAAVLAEEGIPLLPPAS